MDDKEREEYLVYKDLLGKLSIFMDDKFKQFKEFSRNSTIEGYLKQWGGNELFLDMYKAAKKYEDTGVIEED